MRSQVLISFNLENVRSLLKLEFGNVIPILTAILIFENIDFIFVKHKILNI